MDTTDINQANEQAIIKKELVLLFFAIVVNALVHTYYVTSSHSSASLEEVDTSSNILNSKETAHQLYKEISAKEYIPIVEKPKRTLKINAAEKLVYVWKGDSYMLQKKYSKAIEEYSAAIVIDPNYADAYTKRAAAYQNRGEVDDLTKAIADFQKAAELTSLR